MPQHDKHLKILCARAELLHQLHLREHGVGSKLVVVNFVRVAEVKRHRGGVDIISESHQVNVMKSDRQSGTAGCWVPNPEVRGTGAV